MRVYEQKEHLNRSRGRFSLICVSMQLSEEEHRTKIVQQGNVYIENYVQVDDGRGAFHGHVH
jgi:tRNA U54 and U55 pseudouridine synthase Pus10